MMTRQEYMAPWDPALSDAENKAAAKARHRAYYSQFVTPAIKAYVALAIGAERIKASKDGHFNDIPLEKWYRLQRLCTPSPQFKHLNPGGWSLSDSVCIAKAAARIIKEEA